jgi:hypothetical protein
MLRSKVLWRLLAISAVGALVMLMPASLVAGGDPGRDFARCVQSCNDVFGMCGNLCQDECWDSWPNNTPARDACISSCTEGCTVEKAECKKICLAIKQNPCPEEP